LKEEFTILLADRNPHVRDLMFRELRAEGYKILLARNGMEILKFDDGHTNIDLLIVDLAIPDIEQASFISWLKSRMLSLPLIVHSFSSDYEAYAQTLGSAVFIEKNENSIEQLKKVVSNLLKQRDGVVHILKQN